MINYELLYQEENKTCEYYNDRAMRASYRIAYYVALRIIY